MPKTADQIKREYIQNTLAECAPHYRARRKRRGTSEDKEPSDVVNARKVIAKYEADQEKAQNVEERKMQAEYAKLKRAVLFAATPEDALKHLDVYQAKRPVIED